MGLFNKEKVEFKKPFTEKYKLEVTSNIKTGNIIIDSKVEIRWEVKIKSVSANKINLELLTLDNQLIEYNNPLVKNMADMNQSFAKMYSELDLVIDGNYQLIDIKNADLLKLKWERIKLELQDIIAEQPQLVGEIINLNDENFKNPDLLKDIIQKNEFFMIYFHHLYGNKIPTITNRIQKKNIFNTAFIDWEFRNSKESEVPNESGLYTIEGFVETKLNREWVKKYYAGFSHLDLNKVEPVMTEDGIYRIENETGKIIDAVLTRTEIAHPRILYGKTKYELKSESTSVRKEDSKNPESPIKKPSGKPSGYNTEHSFIIDD